MEDESESNAKRDEIALIQAMYPEEVTWTPQSWLLTFLHKGGHFDLRVNLDDPELLPDVVTAQARPNHEDLRNVVKEIISKQEVGEPCLDAIITEFTEYLEDQDDIKVQEMVPATEESTLAGKTVIIWLHHLLATGKRKLAISPTGPQASEVTGITKPGYPGVMIFSGPAAAVEAHVQELKSQRWQAFQVRYEGDETWSFTHGHGIVEVESMGDIVAEVEGTGEQKNNFMQAMKIK
jgi:mannose-6-phosphate isomerase-like protein (cupin superfamily)